MRPPLVVVVNPAFGFGEQLPDGPVAHSSEHGMLELTDQPFGPAVVRWCSGPAHAGDEIPSNEFVDHRIAAVLATLVGMPDNGVIAIGRMSHLLVSIIVRFPGDHDLAETCEKARKAHRSCFPDDSKVMFL